MTVLAPRLRLAAALSLGLLVAAPAAGTAATVPSAQYPTIQAAINGVPDGTVIDVQPGTYFEALTIGPGRSLTIRGIGGPASTIVDATGKGVAAIYVFRAGTVVIQGLTFRHGAPPSAAGGGFLVGESSPSFVNCVFELNSASTGGGGALIASNATFANCVIRNNSAAHFGGGVYITAGSRPVFTNCDIVSNVSGTTTADGAGGGVNAIDASPTFRGSRISNNTSKFAAGGIFHMGAFGSPYGRSMLVIEDSEVADNVSTRHSPAYNPSEGGGMHVEDNATATLTRVRVLRNQAGTGGGLNAYRGRYDIVNSVVDGNRANANNGFGGGIAATSNFASASMPGSVITLNGSLVRNNLAIAGDGSLTGMAGGIAVIGDNFSAIRASLQVTNSVIDGNQAFNQAGGVLAAHSDVFMAGSLVIRNSVSGGSLPFGGGLMLTTASATISGTTIARNTAGLYGGGLFMNDGSTLDLNASNVYDNTASASGGFGGGGLFIGPAGNNSGQVSNSVIADNAGYQIYEQLCPKARLAYTNNTITPRAGNTDLYVSSCAPFQTYTTIGSFETLPNTSGNVSTPPRFAHFLAVPAAGTSATLAWSVARATSVTVGGVGTWNTPPTPSTHTVDVAPAASTTYTLSATATAPNGGNYAPVAANVTVVLPPVVPTGGTEGDFDGDGKSDFTVFRPSNGTWYHRFATGGTAGLQWGNGSDIPVPGDYNGDGRWDVAVFRPSNGTWYVVYTGSGVTLGVQWGNGSDIPVPGDYDGDGRTDIAVFRPSNGTWYLRYSIDGSTAGVQWGNSADITAPGDYDGDGRTDIAVFRPSNGTWYLRYSINGSTAGVQWGNSADITVPGDYDGDGRTDIAVFRPSNGTWYLRYSINGSTAGVQWGNGSDIVVPGDYDGDGRTDVAVFRPSNGTWYLRYSINGSTAGVQWGNGADIPILNRRR